MSAFTIVSVVIIIVIINTIDHCIGIAEKPFALLNSLLGFFKYISDSRIFGDVVSGLSDLKRSKPLR
jgi:hypothetical protein